MADDTSGLDDVLKEAKDAFAICTEHEAENRADALEDIRFARLGEQWPPETRRRRELDNRPCLTFNKMPAFIRQVVNDARQNRPSIKIHPADDTADPETAEIFNGLIRNIEYTSDADVAYDTAIEAAVCGGLGYFRINTCYADDDGFDQDIVLQTVENPFSIWGDPYSVKADSADWNVAFVADTMKKDDFERKYKGADAVDWNATGYGALSSPWLDGEQIMVAEYWTREEVPRTILLLNNGEIVPADEYAENKDMFDGQQIQVQAERSVNSHKVTQRIMTGTEVLETVDWAGKYIPIVPVYGDVVYLEGKRYLRSLIRDAKDGQRNFNYWRTTSTELLALAPRVPFIGPKGSFKTDTDKWATANSESHAYIEYDGAVAPLRQMFAGPAAGAITEAANAADDIKTIIGLHDASLGNPSNETSGRAILMRQKEGDNSTFHFVDNLSRAIRHAGRIMIDLIPHVYSGPRVLRVMGPDGIPQITTVNQPFNQPVNDQNGQPVMAPAMGPMGQPAIGADGQPQMVAQTVAKLFDLTAGKYDLVVEAGPSFATKREEAANQMIQLVQADPQMMPLIGDILVKNLDWEGADEIAQRVAQVRQQQQVNPNNPQAKAQAEAQADMARIQAQGEAKQQQLAQEGQQRQQQMQQEHELALQLAQHQAEIDRQQMLGRLELQRQQNELTIQLKRETAAAELQLARETAQQSAAIKMAEAMRGDQQTVTEPDISIGGGIG